MFARILLVSLVSLFMQIGFFSGLLPEVTMPEFFVPMIIVMALAIGKKEAITLAAISGFVLDIYFRRAFGLRILLFVAIAFVLGSMREKFTRRSIFVISVVTAVTGILYILSYGLGLMFLGIATKMGAVFFNLFSFQIPIQIILSIMYYMIFMRRRHRKVEY